MFNLKQHKPAARISSALLIFFFTLGFSPSIFAQVISTDRGSYEVGDNLKVLIHNASVVNNDDILTICLADKGIGLCHDVWRSVNGSKVSDDTVKQVIEIELPQTLFSGDYQLRLEDSDQNITEAVFFTIKGNEITVDKPSFMTSEDVTASYDLPAEAQDEFQICTQAQLENPEQDCTKIITVDEFASSGSYRVSRQGAFSLPANDIGTGDYKIAYERDNAILATSELFSITEGGPSETIVSFKVTSGMPYNQCKGSTRTSNVCADFEQDENSIFCACGYGPGRGFNMQVMTKAGVALPPVVFDVAGNQVSNKTRKMNDYLDAIEEGNLLLVAVADATFYPYWAYFQPEVIRFYETMETKFGANLIRLQKFRNTYALIAVAGGQLLDEKHGEDFETVVTQGTFVINP